MEMQNPAPPPKNSKFSPPAMDALKKQNKPAETMPVQEIVKQDAEKNGSNVPWQNIYEGLIEATKSPKFRLVRANNSLMGFKNEGNGIATAYLSSSDDPNTLVDSLKQFHQAMLKAGFKQIKLKVTDQEMLKAIQMSGIKVTENMGQHVKDGKASPAINIVMEA